MQTTFVLEAELANDNTFQLVVKAKLIYEQQLRSESLYHVWHSDRSRSNRLVCLFKMLLYFISVQHQCHSAPKLCDSSNPFLSASATWCPLCNLAHTLIKSCVFDTSTVLSCLRQKVPTTLILVWMWCCNVHALVWTVHMLRQLSLQRMSCCVDLVPIPIVIQHTLEMMVLLFEASVVFLMTRQNS